MNLEKLKNCPVCNKESHTLFLSCIDYTVSRETFEVVKCNDCGFVFTNPRPFAVDLGGYYKSDEYISHSNTNKGLINKIYQIVRNYTLLGKLKIVYKFSKLKKGALLDIGCGTGNFLNIVSKSNWMVTGLEPDDHAREFGIKNFGLNVLPAEAIKTIPSNSFDVITMWHVLEHVPNLGEYIVRLKEMLKENGIAIIAVPNCNSYDAKHYKTFWAAYDVPRHLYHFTPSTINKLFSDYGFKSIATLPMPFDSFYVSMLSEKYKGSFAGIVKAFIIGLISNIKAARSGLEYSSQIYIFKK